MSQGQSKLPSLKRLAVKRSGQRAMEYVWCSFPRPAELHDYSYLGADFRERERIRRKARRWREGLMRLPDTERYAVMAAIDELRAG